MSVATYAPIAQSLNTLSEDEQKRLRAKFDIAYFVVNFWPVHGNIFVVAVW